MKILEKGIPPEERKHTLTCHVCQTKFEFFEKEATVTYDQRDGNYLRIDCPVCKHTLTKTLHQTLR